jgi:hypothetical protein
MAIVSATYSASVDESDTVFIFALFHVTIQLLYVKT